MPRPYRFSLAAYICLALFFAAWPARAQDGGAYTIQGVRVDVTADNAVNARQQAFDKAGQAALMALADRLSPGASAGMQPPAPSVVATMVDDFEITQEQLSNVRYIGTYTFRFRPPAVQAWMAQAASETAAPEQTESEAPPPDGGVRDGVWRGSILPQAAETQPALMPQAPAALTARAAYSGLGDWIALRRAVESTPGVAGIDVVAMSPRSATIAIRSALPQQSLAANLAAAGFSLSGGPVYTLSRTR